MLTRNVSIFLFIRKDANRPRAVSNMLVAVQPSKDSDKTGKEMFPYRSRFR
jgi:hypothetical protein